MTESTSATAQDFLDHFVSVFNASVRRGNFADFVRLFAGDAVLEYDGIPDPPIEGIAAIARRYQENPPDDEIRVIRWKAQGDRIMAEFRWCDIPEASGGCCIIQLRGGEIAHLTVAFGGPASRCFR